MAINALPEEYILNNDYKILESLGQGGFGITYLAEDMSLGHQVVIKEFLPQSMAVRDQSHYTVSPYTQEDALYSKMLKRFIEEARLIAGLNHPNIVKVTRLLEANDTAYFVMPYEEGETLEDYLDHVPKLKESDILQIMMPILEGTKYVHANGVLHRDIAPDNIYLKQNGMPMLIDFGAARNAIAQKSQTISAIAKEGYSPPEQYTPNTDQTAATDIYALGAVFYRMITGNKPASASQRQMALLKGDPDPIGDLKANYKNKYSSNLLEAVTKALDVHQERRFQDIGAFQKAITEGVIVNSNHTVDTQKKTKANKGLVVGLMVSLLALGGMGAYILGMDTTDKHKFITIENNTTMNDTENRKQLSEEEQVRLDRIAEQKQVNSINESGSRSDYSKVVGIKYGDILNMRSDAGSYNRRVGRLTYDTTGIQVIKCKQSPSDEKWCLVRHDNIIGWVRAKNIDSHSSSSQTSTNDTSGSRSDYSKVVGIKYGDILNMRSDAGSYNRRVGRLTYDTTGIQVIKCKQSPSDEKWCLVRHDNIIGWVRAKNIDSHSSSSQTSTNDTSGSRSDYSKVVGIKYGDILNMRSDAGSYNRRVGRLTYDTTDIEVIKCKQSPSDEKWCLVRHDNIIGWVSAKYLREQ